MEMSSPLAAMHPPPIPGPWGYRRDLPQSKQLFGGASLAPKNFNFRDLSMKKSGGDYFAMQPRVGSSPTASLAADMSSNLHVDQSPQLATPRRSLFTSNLFQQLDTRVPRWEGVTTPPIPSSSPGFAPDSMDISPLPHKAPFSFAHDRSLPLPSPSPEVTPSSDGDMLSPCEDLSDSSAYPTPNIEVPRPVSAADRRKSALLRPALSRSKNYSNNSVSFKDQDKDGENAPPPPPFQFGCGDFNRTSSSLSLDECFSASPPQDRSRPTSNGSLFGSSRPKPYRLNSTATSSSSGSPLAAVRKPAGPPSRRPSKFRRSLSMFESPGEVMNAKQEQENYQPSGLQSVMDIDDVAPLKLPHFTISEPESIPRITRETLVEVLDGVYDHLYDNKVVIDCRFEYEYNGGHIEGALNFCDKEKLAERLFQAPSSENTLLVLHCEYSAHRAPLMAKFVRSQDRKENAHQYPHLSFPEVYILDGGYSSFFHAHATRCHPQNYLRMDAKEHEQSCERGLNKLKFKSRAKLNRATTFTFGQPCQMEDSPTAMSRSRSGNNIFGLGNDSLDGARAGASRRLASY
ncbi:uncharacterized protein SETTUDRAFT_32178 [Exserohilum turcica Et28A]|uniref:M-phase inducer phosphatase n=1 Tax=Exserohilum turcicum (strain 28A) TaxID=671987 RepID=R0JV98_EXST2|nr:uncharacterized protein SETTUDRAFT_32178 [Exserohilum turcica Et28A]EOA84938.1 hypothetical protein SETTUDRAFT_32178 [Exserohilum turcica Et28A]